MIKVQCQEGWLKPYFRLETGKSLVDKYNSLIKEGKLNADPCQKLTLEKLNKLSFKISSKKNKSFFNKFSNLIISKPKQNEKGVYIWGGVGRGKSMLMDLFFNNVRFKSKKRTHFHNFMADTHDLIHKLRKDQSIKNIPDKAAELISNKSKLLCFDEMELRDIADAMVLNRLFNGLWNRGVIIVATSNRPPEKLYEKGLHRDRVLPFIRNLEERCEVIEIGGDNDFRLSVRKGMEGWFSPVSKSNSKTLKEDFEKLIGEIPSKPDYIPSAGRQIHIPSAASGIALIDFKHLCEKKLAARDYIEVAKRYRGLIIDKIPILDNQNRNESRRFMWLIDALYEAKCFLICSAEKPINEIYTGDDWKFEFERTKSRLIELTASPR